MALELEKTPRNLLVCEKSSLENDKNRLSKQIQDHYYNYQVSVLVPECSGLPPDVSDFLSNLTSFYLLRQLPVYRLLESSFLQEAVYKGGTYGLSHHTRIDEDNTVALLPTGHLILSVDKDTYELLGLEGRESRYNHRHHSRYVVTINLKDSKMSPGQRFYQRVVTSLRDRVQLKTDFLLARHAPDGGGGLQSLLAHCDWTIHRPKVGTRLLDNLSCPTLQSHDLLGEEPESCDTQELLEWLGCVEGGVSCNNASDSHVSTYVCPEPHRAREHALLCTVSGLITPEDVYDLIKLMRQYVEQPGGSSWLAVTVKGFVDSPVAWTTAEHGFLQGGDSLYSVVLFEDAVYWMMMMTGPHDDCPP